MEATYQQINGERRCDPYAQWNIKQSWERRKSAKCNNMDGPCVHYDKWSKSDRETCMTSLICGTRQTRTCKNRVEWWLPRSRDRDMFLFIKIIIFLMWTIFKVFIEFITISLLFLYCVFLVARHVGILALWLGIKLIPPILEAKS